MTFPPLSSPHAVHLGLLAWVFAGALGCGAAPPHTTPHVPVRVAKAEIKDVPYIIEGPGTVAPLQTVSIQPQVAGTVRKVDFQEGQDVAADQILFEIEPDTYRAALAKAEAALAHDVEGTAQAEREAARADALGSRQDLSVEETEQKRSTAVAGKATVAADRAAVDAAKVDLGHAILRAPFAGRSGRVTVHVGDTVRVGGDTPLVVIDQLQPIAVEFHVPQAALAEINGGFQRGLSVEATPPGGTAEKGTLSFVDNAVDPGTGTVLVKGSFDNADHALWPGAFVVTRLLLRTESGRVVVPGSAVTTGQSGPYVYVVGADGAATQRPVTVERQQDDQAILSAGLKGGDTVVTDGQLRLSAGATVDVMTGKSEAPK